MVFRRALAFEGRAIRLRISLFSPLQVKRTIQKGFGGRPGSWGSLSSQQAPGGGSTGSGGGGGLRPRLMLQKVARWTSDPQALASSLLSAGGGLIAAATEGRLSGHLSDLAASAGGSLAGSLGALASSAAAAGLGEGAGSGEDGEEGVQPEFLPMVPWYSGTSADLLKTALDLAITLKLFVGRFDMRTMQVCDLITVCPLHAWCCCPSTCSHLPTPCRPQRLPPWRTASTQLPPRATASPLSIWPTGLRPGSTSSPTR